MKLIKREVVIDNETFRPQIIITIALDLQLAEEQMAVDPVSYTHLTLPTTSRV